MAPLAGFRSRHLPLPGGGCRGREHRLAAPPLRRGGVTRAGGVAAAAGLLGWALASEPWQLFAATVASGLGWAATGAAAINAMVSPWFAAKRPAALAIALQRRERKAECCSRRSGSPP